jgi:predicted GNAT family acetyltransferase
MDIQIIESESKGMSLAKENDNQVGSMTYSIAGPELIIIDHTEVDPAYNGKGVGKQMLYKIVEMARQKNIKIIPLCPFAASLFRKLEEIKDVLK